jgi:hypothetical protein
VAITSLDFPDNETTTFWVGTEEGNLYQANRYDRAGSKAGLNPYDVYRGHAGAITGIDFHPSTGPIDFGDLILTSSVDWTIKLWRAKSLQKQSTTPSVVNPLYSFEESDDYVYDVRWHPTHPAVFASVNGVGRMDVWNLNIDTEVRSSPILYNTTHLPILTRFPSHLPPLVHPHVLSTSLSGTAKTDDDAQWAHQTGRCTSTISATWRFPGRANGQSCRGRWLV